MKFASLLLLISLTIFACRKDDQNIRQINDVHQQVDSLQLQTVKSWLKEKSDLQTNLVTSDFRISELPIDWTTARSFQSSSSNYWLIPLPGQPTVNKVEQGFRKIAFFKDSLGHLQSRIIEFIPDVLYWQRKGRVSTNDYTGRIFYYDLSYNYISGKIYANGKQVGESKPARTGISTGTSLTTNQTAVSEDCYWHDSNYLDAEGHVVIHSEKICTYTVYDDGWYPSENGDSGWTPAPASDPIGGSSNGGSPSPPPAPPEPPELPGEDLDKIDPKEYVRCFGTISNTGAVMKVTLYVQQPYPGTVFNVGPNSVGHVALGLSKTNGSSTIRQTFGFYPNATGINKFHAPSKVIDNGGGMDYQLSITYDVTATQFQAILDYVNTPPATYDIVENNCTNFAVNALANGGVMAPDAYSVVGMNGVGGTQSAMTPAGLGNSISQMQGKPGVNTTGGGVPGSKGPCK